MNRHSNPISALIIVTFLLASCGGGGGGGGSGGSANVNKPTASILWKFDDSRNFLTEDPNYGVIRSSFADQESGAVVFNYIMFEVEEFANRVRQGQGGDDNTPDSVNISGLELVQRLGNGNIYQGAIQFPNFTLNAIAYENSEEENAVGAIYLGNSNATMLFAGGVELTNIPTGTHKYNGFIGIAPRLSFDERSFDHGNFTMTVDFGDERGEIGGEELTSPRLEGNFNINITNGSFRGNALDLTVGSYSSQASLYGNFHGNGALGVTGVFHAAVGPSSFSSSATEYSGMLVGVRTDQRNQ